MIHGAKWINPNGSFVIHAIEIISIVEVNVYS